MSMADLTRKWLDTPWRDVSCIAFVHAFIEEGTGKTLPSRYGNLTIDNHFEYWRQNPGKVERALCEAVEVYTRYSDPKHPKLFDMLVVRIKNHGLIPAVYVGKGCAMASFIITGVQVFALDENNKAILAGAF